MKSVKAHLTIAAMALAFGALSAPANATISTPFGSINAGGFGLIGGVPTPFFGVGGQQQDFSVRTPFGGISLPGFGVGNGGPGAGGYHTGFGVFNPINWGGPGFGLGGPGYPPGVTPFFGLNEQQALSVRTPFGGFSGPGFGVSTPFGGFYGPGFGVSTPWGGMNMGGFGISTPWGGMQTPIFGLNGQPIAGGPQIVPVMVPYPVPMQGPMMGGAPAQGGAQPTQCMINAVPALTKSVDDCEKAGGAAVPQRTSAVQEAKKE